MNNEIPIDEIDQDFIRLVKDLADFGIGIKKSVEIVCEIYKNQLSDTIDY
jgi:hypothetical protein